MPISYIDTQVMCPFYKYSDSRRHKIACEGIVDGSSIIMFYQDKRDFQIQMNAFCCEHYKNCEIYGILDAKYE